jgi:threonylcarbamoyladenosine tRNA methylthiotransferase MtaB
VSVVVVTFGCRLNAYESELMRARASEAGLEDAILVNTCAVTAEAVRQAEQAIRRARRDHAGKRIVVTGCAAQIEPQRFAAMAEVDLVLGNAEKLTRAAYAGDFGVGSTERVRVGDITAVRATAPQFLNGFADRVRAFVQIQNGCDHRCTFCVIPYGRGPSRSVPAGAVVEQVRRLVAGGVREIVLTGVDITSWGADLPGQPRLGKLVSALLKRVPELPRLRLSSIDSVEVDEDMMRAIAEEDRLMPHLHLSLQAGDDLILKRMKRRHRRADAVRFCGEVRRLRPDIALGADIIAGFPTETETMLANSLSLIEDCGLALLHVFPFSPRKGTPAARMPQLPRQLVKERAARLREAGAAALARRLAAEVGSTRRVLIEVPGFGRSEHYLAVETEAGEPGSIASVRIGAANQARLRGETLRQAA